MFVQLLSNTTVVSHSCVVECFRKPIAIATLAVAFISSLAVAVVILRQIYLKKKRSYNW